MPETLKIVIPTAGLGTRMRPQTWSKPKPLVSVAGKAALDHLLDSFHTLPAGMTPDYIFVVGPGLGEEQIPSYMKAHHPGLKSQFVVQPEMKGQSDALWLACRNLIGPMLMIFSDTLIEADFSLLEDEEADGVAWVKPIQDPRRFGVAKVDMEGWITEIIEKPEMLDNKLVVVGCYYFRQVHDLVSAIEEQTKRGKTLKGEYFLADAINVLLERGARMRTQIVDVWLDTGTISATLETNRYLLEHGRENSAITVAPNVRIIRPVFIHPESEISNSTIGPHVSIGVGCRILDSRIEDSILEDRATVRSAALKGSFIGRHAKVEGRSADDPPITVNIGDNSSVQF